MPDALQEAVPHAAPDTVPATASFTVHELRIPATIDDDSAEFRQMVEVRNAAEAEVFGNHDLAYPAEELLPRWNDPYEPKRLFVARVDGLMVGRAIYETRTDEASATCWLNVEVLEAHRDSGIEEELHDRVLQLARGDGKQTVNFYQLHRETGSTARIGSPTGFGSVAADEHGVVFLTSQGYALGQVERISRLTLPPDPDLLHANLAEATAAAGPDYRVVQWIDVTPERWISDVAELNTRMSTDAPVGEMNEDEDPWDDERVRADDARTASGPSRLLVAAVEHVPTGRVVAFNELSVPPEMNRPVSQEDTLVLPEHRGHRLGILVKVANLLQLEDYAPGHPSVITYNAEENRYMLAVNEAVGFTPVGFEGGWTRTI